YHGNPAINPSNPSIALLFLLFFQNSTFTQGFGDGVTNKRLCFDTVWGAPQQANRVSAAGGNLIQCLLRPTHGALIPLINTLFQWFFF
ncbi:hypothetical protein, partial [Eubacterium callanderi]|uniref:hypothetical protein n=1 Tax=Eubacterium callanderi TaxID=53442 RepID=UPI003AF1AE7D